MSSIAKEFGLTTEQMHLMYSLQYRMILKDIDTESNENKQILKKEWRNLWVKEAIESLRALYANHKM